MHSLLEKGATAYRRGDYAEAAFDWRTAAKLQEGVERDLCQILARLAAALAAGAGSQEAEALRQARAELGEIPAKAVLGLDLERLRQDWPFDREVLQGPPPLTPARRLRKRAVARFALMVLVVLGALAALRWTPLAELTNRELVVAQLDALSQAWWAPLALLGLYLFVCGFGLPVSGLIFAGAVVFGPVRGTLFNVLGSFLGAIVAYVVARSLGRELVEHLAGDRLKRVERLMDRQGFWTLLRIRLLPVPFPMINFGAALVGVKPLTYFTSSFFGILIPIGLFSILYASIGRTLLEATGDEARAMTLDALIKVILLLGALVAVTSLPQLWINLQRRRRYLRLLEQRRQRRSS